MAKSKATIKAPQFVRYFGPVLDALQKLRNVEDVSRLRGVEVAR